jgi:hypothetical protein
MVKSSIGSTKKALKFMDTQIEAMVKSSIKASNLELGDHIWIVVDPQNYRRLSG